MYLKRHLYEKKYFAVENIQVIAEGEPVNDFAIGTICFCTTITYLRSLAFKVGELKQFSYAPNQDRHHWNEMILWVHETTLTSKSKGATC